MILMDMPSTVFNKVLMNIVGPLPTTESGYSYIVYSYIVTIQYLRTKYSVAVLKQAMSSKIFEALVEKFINPYTAPKAWIID